MITFQLLNPSSIVVVGGSNDVTKPGGRLLSNLINGNFKGELSVVNPKEDTVQGIKSYHKTEELPNVDLAVLAIAAKYCLDTVKLLVEQKNTKAIIILSAGFSEESNEGKIIEDQIVELCNAHKCALIGPNCVGILTPQHHSYFTLPIPKLNPKGVDFITGSGATAVFILTTGILNGLQFANVFSVGNSAQIGVEDVLEYMDETYNPETSSSIKMLYIESLHDPQRFLKATCSLTQKGCKIVAVKAGSSDAGSRAASSHTGALANSDVAVDALFKKAGIVRCYGREELVAAASVFTYKELHGKNIAIITHAGGPAVMLTDTLSKGGLNVPKITHPKATELLQKLYLGSSVNNPIDFLATGTAEQLGIIVDYCDNYFDEIDAMVVIFGTPGLFRVFDVYKLLDEKIKHCKKPIFPVLPSLVVAKEEVDEFISKGNVNFPDEVILGKALSRAVKVQDEVQSAKCKMQNDEDVNNKKHCTLHIAHCTKNGYLSPETVSQLLDELNIPRVKEIIVTNIAEIEKHFALCTLRFAQGVVMKVIGPVHKSDVGGVVLNVKDVKTAKREFERLMKIPEATGILVQEMVSGMELFVGVKKEGNFGHLIMCGMGGIFIEILKDVATGLAPIGKEEALKMIKSLKCYKMLEGVRGQKGINIHQFADIIVALSDLVAKYPEITEMDINPLLGNEYHITAVDARIKVL
ncbi:MAG: acetate--CoA ligase family protein [Bacteroidales bacterium]|jgi:acetyltransferase|nr:acetate--CoA ligase family protein [Bacteroidales bacterium]